MRDDEERAEARQSLAFLQALRHAIPASLDDSSTIKDSFRNYEATLIAKANGEPATSKRQRRWSPSKAKTTKP